MINHASFDALIWFGLLNETIFTEFDEMKVSIALQVFSLASEIFSCATSELLAELMWLSSQSIESRH